MVCTRHAQPGRNTSGRRTTPIGRSAFTLLELILVLALLVVVAALSWPALEKPLAHERLRKAADQLHAAWTHARVEAINSGDVQSFRYRIGEAQYSFERWGALDVSSADQSNAGPGNSGPDSAGFAGAAAGSGPAPAGASTGKSLPDGILFLDGQTLADSRAAAAGAGDASDDSWSPPVLFYPDGTTSTAEVILRNEYDSAIVVSLRGLTGTCIVGEPLTLEEGR